MKGKIIKRVDIINGIISATYDDGTKAKLTRGERDALTMYKKDDYLDIVRKKFNNPKIVDDSLVVYKNGVQKYPRV